MTAANARDWLGGLLERSGRATRHKTPPGPAMGSWVEQWDRVKLGLNRVEAVYAGRREDEGSAGASYDVFAFFVICHHLADWIENDPAVRRPTQRRARDFRSKSVELKVCADLANRSKHSALEGTRTGDPSTGPSRQDVSVMLGQGAKHAFQVSSGGEDRDALDLARACVGRWETFLKRRHLL